MSGENHPNSGRIKEWWQPWMNYDVNGRTWTLAIKRAFNNRCAICDKHRGLHAHHVIPKSNQPDLKYDLLNGIVLCHRCHNGKDNMQNVHKLLRESPEEYERLMKILLLKRQL